MPDNKEAMIFQLEADDSGVKKKILDVETAVKSAAAKVKKHSGSTSGQVKKDINGVAKSAKDSAREMKSTAAGTASSIGSSFSSMAKKIGLAMAAAFSVTKIVSFGKECLSLGSDLAEVQNVVDVTFETMSGDVDKFAKSAAKQFGLSETMAKKYAGTYGSMADAFGFTEKQALAMSESLTGLTGDVASFYNITQDEAYTKLKSVFSGETESLKDLGVVMTQDALNAYALANGYGKTVSQMSEMEKVSLRYAFVSDKLANAQGDYARTSDGWANSTRTLSLQFATLKAELGQGLINVFSPIVAWLNTIIERLTTAAKKFKEFTANIMGIQKDVENSGEASAIASTELLNSSLGETETSAKKASKAMRDLMGFDEINRLSDNSTDTDTAATSAPAVSASGANQNENKNKDTNVSALEAPLKRIKALWDELYGSFKRGLKTRLDAGNVTTALDTIKKNLNKIKDALAEIFTDSNVLGSARYMWNQIAELFGSLIGNVLSIGANLAAAFAQGIADFLDKKKEFLKEKITSIFETTGDIFGSLTDIMNDVTGIINHILQLPETAKVIADAINIVITPLATGIDLILKFVKDNLDGLAQVISDNKEGFMKIGEDIMKFFASVTDAISDFVDTVCAKAEEVYTQYIKPAIDNIWEGINNLVSFLIGIWQKYISPFLQKLGEDIGELYREHIAPMVEKVMEFCGKLWLALSELWKNVLEPVVEWIVRNVAPKVMFVVKIVWNALKTAIANIADIIGWIMDVLGGWIDFLTGVFTGDWKKAWGGIKSIFSAHIDLIKNVFGNFESYVSGVVDAIKEFFADMGENIRQNFSEWWGAVQKIFSNVKQFFSDAFGAAWKAIKEVFSNPQQFFNGVWNKITGVFSGAKNVFKEKFDAAVNGIKEAFNGIKEWFSRLWDDIATALKSPVNSMIDILNYLIDKINTLSFDIPDWVPEFGGRTFGFNIPEIPHLATGGYVKANTPQLAVIGDNRREGEIVAPESKIAEAVAKAMQMVLSRLGGAGGSGQPQGEMVLQANIWLGNELLAKKLANLQKVRDYRSGGLA